MRFSIAIGIVFCLMAVDVYAEVPKLRFGEPAPPVTVGEYIQGDPIDLRDGNIHVLQFWSTSGGPKLADFVERYPTVGFLAVNIYEPGEDYVARVRRFVESANGKMNYPVATDDAPGIGSMFRNWVQGLAGIEGQQTVVVVGRTGEVMWAGSPGQLQGVLDQVLEGTFDVAAAAQRQAHARASANRFKALAAPLMEAYKAQLWPDVVRHIERIVTEHAEYEKYLVDARFDALMHYDETAAYRYLEKASATVMDGDAYGLNQIAWKLAGQADRWTAERRSLAVRIARRAFELTDRSDGNVLDTYAFAVYKTGDVAQALKLQEQALALAEGGKDPCPEPILQALAQRLEQYRREIGTRGTVTVIRSSSSGGSTIKGPK